MAWVVLILAGLFEIVWAYSMKLSEGFTKLTPSLITLFIKASKQQKRIHLDSFYTFIV